MRVHVEAWASSSLVQIERRLEDTLRALAGPKQGPKVWCASPPAPGAQQVVSSSSGELMDEFVLTKPPGWAPAARELSVERGHEGGPAGLQVGGPAAYPGGGGGGGGMVAAA